MSDKEYIKGIQEALIRVEKERARAAREEAHETAKLAKLEAKRSERLEKANQNLEKALERKRRREEAMSGMGSIFSKQRINYEISRLSPAMAAAAKAGYGTIFEMSQGQKRAGAFGRDLNQVAGLNREVMKSGIGGFGEQIESQLSIMEAGFKDIPKSFRDLATGMRLSGQNEGKLIKALRESVIAGGVSVEETGELSKTLNKTTKEYGVKTESLIDSFGSLESKLESNLLGTTKNVDDAIIKLTGKFGAESGQMIRQFVDGIGKLENMSQATMAGINEHVATILNSNSTSEQIADAIEASIDLMGSMSKSLARVEGGDKRVAKEIAKAIGGDIGMIAASLSNIEQNTKAGTSTQRDFNSTFGTMLKETFSPLEKAMFDIFGGNQTEIIDISRSMNAGIWTLVAAQGIGGVIKSGVRGVATLNAVKEVGLKNAWLRSMGFEAVTQATATEGASVATAAGFGSKAAAAAPWLLAAAAVTGAGWLIYRASTAKEREIESALNSETEKLNTILNRRNSAVGVNSETESSLSRASLNANYSAMSINIQREQAKMLQELIREVKRNRPERETNINLGGF